MIWEHGNIATVSPMKQESQAGRQIVNKPPGYSDWSGREELDSVTKNKSKRATKHELVSNSKVIIQAVRWKHLQTDFLV